MSAIHSGEQTCDICGKSYKNKSSLYSHKSGTHSGEQTCQICGLVCENKFSLRRHKKEYKKRKR